MRTFPLRNIEQISRYKSFKVDLLVSHNPFRISIQIVHIIMNTMILLSSHANGLCNKICSSYTWNIWWCIIGWFGASICRTINEIGWFVHILEWKQLFVSFDSPIALHSEKFHLKAFLIWYQVLKLRKALEVRKLRIFNYLFTFCYNHLQCPNFPTHTSYP